MKKSSKHNSYKSHNSSQELIDVKKTVSGQSSGYIVERLDESVYSLSKNDDQSNGSTEKSLHSAYKRPEKTIEPEEEEVKEKDSKSFESVSISQESEKDRKMQEEEDKKFDQEFDEQLRRPREHSKASKASGSMNGSLTGTQESNRRLSLALSPDKEVTKNLLEMTKKERQEESIIAPQLQILLKHNERAQSHQNLNSSGNLGAEIREKIEIRMNMFGVSQEKYELEKYGYKKLSNIQEAMTAKVQKQLHGLNEEDRTLVKSLKKERDERTRFDYETMIKYF